LVPVHAAAACDRRIRLELTRRSLPEKRKRRENKDAVTRSKSTEHAA
jgi:hypothetical protein